MEHFWDWVNEHKKALFLVLLKKKLLVKFNKKQNPKKLKKKYKSINI